MNILNKEYSIYNLKNGHYDIFHPTYYSPYFLKYIHKPFVVTIHDLIYEKFERKNSYKILKWKKILIENASKIIAISNNTKFDLLKYYSISEDKISVVYHGFNKQTNFKYLKNIFGNYLLYVGRREDYKNFNRFIKAISPILKNDKTLKLICTGYPFSNFELKLLIELEISDQVICISANEQELNSLYKNALLFIFPSLYEGFGMPILEAFANDCPICISNSSSLPEIAKDAALYFDPYDENSIYETIKQNIYNDSKKQTLIKKGRIRLSDFSWESAVNNTINVYKEVLMHQ